MNGQTCQVSQTWQVCPVKGRIGVCFSVCYNYVLFTMTLGRICLCSRQAENDALIIPTPLRLITRNVQIHQRPDKPVRFERLLPYI